MPPQDSTALHAVAVVRLVVVVVVVDHDYA